MVALFFVLVEDLGAGDFLEQGVHTFLAAAVAVSDGDSG
jgi:hypothetical protein